MGKPRHTAEQIVSILREAEVLMSKGMSTKEVMRQLGIRDATYYHKVMAPPQVVEGIWQVSGGPGKAVERTAAMEEVATAEVSRHRAVVGIGTAGARTVCTRKTAKGP